MQTIYKEKIISKTGITIPVLQSGKTIESRYNPQADAIRKFISLNVSEKFIILIGCGSGLLLNEIATRLPDAIIIVVEYSSEDILFLKSINEIKKLSYDNRIHIIPKEDLYKEIINSYFPALYGNMRIIEQTNYSTEFPEYLIYIKNEIKNALNSISKDYSVQSHFGKIWQKNIISNLNLKQKSFEITADINKICVILAAGPSLDLNLQKLKYKRDLYYVIATDTAYLSAKKNNIFIDAVVSLDGQMTSLNHFMTPTDNSTIFFFDWSSNSSLVRKTKKNTNKIIFFRDGHPLSNLLDSGNELSPYIYSGAGTVTISALDIAFQMGFKKIEVWGADFSYLDNKCYAKGTYLDILYNKNSNKINSSEKTFSKLMYRTDLLKNKQITTTEVLESYRNSFLEYLSNKNIIFKKEQNIYVIENKVDNINDGLFFKTPNIENFKSIVLKNITDNKFLSISSNNKLIKAILPAMAFYRRKNSDKKTEEILNLACTQLLRLLKL
ncbi:MAG: motility associated factor glycosyltransferase family protein [Treponema sp.]|nr:motility associated factor glycosyltransferase family protein [Clostridia bacterium]MCF0241560.1 motility associated factor glycosyltransferase family protein [Treponema sp.]